MTTRPAISSARHEPELPGQTAIMIGGSSGIGLQTARRARAEGADVILTGRNPGRLAARRGPNSARCALAGRLREKVSWW